MSRAARSLFVFGVYVVVVGVTFAAVPQIVIRLLGLPAAADGWVRVVALLALVIGAYDIAAAWNDLVPYVRASIPIRVGFAIGTVVLFLTGQMPAPILLFGLGDLAGATWTWLVLEKVPAVAQA